MWVGVARVEIMGVSPVSTTACCAFRGEARVADMSLGVGLLLPWRSGVAHVRARFNLNPPPPYGHDHVEKLCVGCVCVPRTGNSHKI